MIPRILVVEDDAMVRDALLDTLTNEGYQVASAPDGPEGITLAQQKSFQSIILDLNLPTMNGLDVLRKIKQIPDPPPVIVLTAYGSVENAVAAMKIGAIDFLVKPCPMKELKTLLRSVISHSEIHESVEIKLSDSESIVGESRAMKKAIERAKKVAPTNSDVLIYGDTGTGKDLIARAIHNESMRKYEPFIKFDCASLPSELLESEIFGHEAGAFTGAKKRYAGKFEQAHGGTIFLDEISNLTLAAQAKLLNIIQDRKFARIGGTAVIEVDVRIISATNKDLRQLITKGLFREDLLYRLEVVSLTLPVLSEHKEDIPALSGYFLKKFNEKNDKNIRGIEQEALDALMNYPFPGNIRELQNLIQNLVVTIEHEMIRMKDLPSKITQFQPLVPGSRMSTRESLHSLSLDKAKTSLAQDDIINALNECHGNKKRAAAFLNVSRVTLYNKIKAFNIKI